MSIKKSVICDKCGEVIRDSTNPHIEGVTILGNIYVSDSSKDDGIGGGLSGSNSATISLSHYHTRCILWILGVEITMPR